MESQLNATDNNRCEETNYKQEVCNKMMNQTAEMQTPPTASVGTSTSGPIIAATSTVLQTAPPPLTVPSVQPNLVVSETPMTPVGVQLTPVPVASLPANISTSVAVVTSTPAICSVGTQQMASASQTPSPSGGSLTRMVPLIYLSPSSVNMKSAGQVVNANTAATQGTNTTTTAVQFTMPQIIAGNPQIIHANSSQPNQAFAYFGTLIKQGLKGKETTSQKVLLTPMSVQNKNSQMASVLLPANEGQGHGGKPPVASLILQPGPGGNAGKMTGLILQGNPGTNSSTGKASLLLPAPPGGGGGKKAITNLNIPMPSAKANIPNIIRQSSGQSNANNKSLGYILPPGSNSTSLIIPNPAGKTSGNQVTGLILPANTPSSGLILPPSTSSSPGKLANLILTTTPTSLPQATSQATNSQVTSLIISNSGIPASSPSTGLIVTTVAGTTTGSSTTVVTTSTPAGTKMTSLFLPVSVAGPGGKPGNMTHLTISNGKIHTTEPCSSIAVSGLKPITGLQSGYSLPPLQPITNSNKEPIQCDNCNIIVQPKPNGLNIPDTLTLTPINEGKHPVKDELKDNEMEVETKSEKEEAGAKTEMKQEVKNEIKQPPDGTADNSLVLDGEVTVRLLGNESAAPGVDGIADKENTSPDGGKMSTEDDVKIEVIKQEHEKTPPIEEFDPMKVLEWDTKGVGKLPGSELKFRLNEFGMMILHDESDVKSDPDSVSSCNTDRKEEKRPHKEPVKAKDNRAIGDDILCCEGCGCYGLFSEFVDTKYCSIACKKILQTKVSSNKKREDEKSREIRLRRQRRKMKYLQKLKMRKDSDIRFKDDGEIDWIKEFAELRAKKARAAVAARDNGDHEGESSEKGDILESPAASEIGDVSIRSGTTSPTLTDDDADKRMPWVSKSGDFLWNIYLSHCKAKAAPMKLFKDPFPYTKNGFRVGMKVEGIDPEHQSFISVLTVVEVKGYRIRLHFDGFPENHDFWTNADSPEIFPPGWCEKNNHHLHRPRGYTLDNFNWNMYLKQCKAQPAPRHLFRNRNINPFTPNQFRVGMKLEAVDRKNSSLVCVATVADIIDNRLLIHFDSWGEIYDYWVDPNSPHIHPVGWCKENGHTLTPPNTYKNPASFSWDSYLKEMKAVAAPARAFKTRPPTGFRRGMKLEAVDKHASHLIRVATVASVHQHQIKLAFDGFPEHFGYWIDDDSPDIHPVGWARKTAHPLEPPPSSDERVECTTPGCRGDGHIKGPKYTSHKNVASCPYNSQCLNKDPVSTLPDRFCTKAELYGVPEVTEDKLPEVICSKIKREDRDSSVATDAAPRSSNDPDSGGEDDVLNGRRSVTSNEDNSPTVEMKPMKTRYSSGYGANQSNNSDDKDKREESKGKKRKLIEDPDEFNEELKNLRKEIIESVLRPGYQVKAESSSWLKHSQKFGQKADNQGDPRRWTYKQVASFINSIHPIRTRLFIDQEIDGEALLMLSQSDLTEYLGLKLGPSIKIFNVISQLRHKLST